MRYRIFALAVSLCLAAGLIWSSLPHSAAHAEAAPPTRKVRVENPEAGRMLRAGGARLIADYGSFALYEASETLATTLSQTGRAELADDYNHILLNAGIVNTAAPETKALSNEITYFEGKRLHLVQFAGPIKPEWYDELLKTGVEVVTYIPNNSYLIYGDAASLNRVHEMKTQSAFLQWDGAYLGQYKVDPAARAAQVGKEALANDLYAIQMVADKAANADTLGVIERFKLDEIFRQEEALGYYNVIVRLRPEALDEIAAQPEVVSIQPYFIPQKRDERQNIIVSGLLNGNAPSGPGYYDLLASWGFTQEQFDASGFAVDVSDSGIDNATTSPNHFALYRLGVRPGTSRVVYNRLEGTPNTGSTLQGCDGHGTINAHIVAGYIPPSLNGFPHVDSSGYRYGLGVAPFVRVGSSVVFDPDYFTRPNYFDLQARAWRDGARISTNSWGSRSNTYTLDSQQYDSLVRDAQQSGSAVPAPGNQEMVIIFAAGNSGPGANTVGSPGTAKNVISVGAAENVHPFGGNDGCSISDAEADSANDVIFFSSRGPTADGRKKPDILAPGTHITGGVFQVSNPPVNGQADSCFDAGGVCGGPGSNFFPAGQEWYTTSSGTSHSTPAVAGGAALVRQYFINNFGGPASPAMTKAYLMNSTRYMTGVGANDTLWSNSQGMGMMNLGRAFDGVPRILRDQRAADKFTATGQERIITGRIVDPTKPFRVTLAWTDAPGPTSGSAWRNDLDLIVSVGGQTYLGNVFNGASSVTGGARDDRNNVESVFLPAGVSGPFVIRVRAANINSDGVPNDSDSLDQDFALVAYNAQEQPSPVITGVSADITVESCPPGNGVIDPSERVTLNVTLRNDGTASASNLVATLQPSANVIAPSEPQNYGALAVGASASRLFSFTAAGNCGDQITLTFRLQDGSSDLGTVTFTLRLGQLVVNTAFAENFDGVTPPTLPSGWTTSQTGAAPLWVTSNVASDTAPNSAYSASVPSVGVNELVTPPISIPTSTNFQLTFRHRYLFESGSTIGFDGGVLEIKIGSGGFQDIIAAGGSFVTGGYVRALSTSFGNPLGGRQAWTGSTNNAFITTTVNLPPSASGQTIQLRWRAGFDRSVSPTGAGWFIDSIQISASSYVCTPCMGEPRLLTKSQLSCGPNGAIVATITVSNAGTGAANDVVLTNVRLGSTSGTPLPQSLGDLAPGASATATVQFPAGTSGNILRVGGTYSGGTFGGGARVTPPSCP